jgi:hypothetical protein
MGARGNSTAIQALIVFLHLHKDLTPVAWVSRLGGHACARVVLRMKRHSESFWQPSLGHCGMEHVQMEHWPQRLLQNLEWFLMWKTQMSSSIILGPPKLLIPMLASKTHSSLFQFYHWLIQKKHCELRSKTLVEILAISNGGRRPWTNKTNVLALFLHQHLPLGLLWKTTWDKVL